MLVMLSGAKLIIFTQTAHQRELMKTNELIKKRSRL